MAYGYAANLPQQSGRLAAFDLKEYSVSFNVIVADNFHYMDESENYVHGTFATLEEAIAAAKRIVDEYLASAYKPGLSAAELYHSYVNFGEDPYIAAEGQSGVLFSAWDYARERCAEMCSADQTGEASV